MWLRLLPWAICAVIVLFSAATFSGLPAEIPRHVDAAGAVTRSAPTTWFSWMLLPMITVLTQALLSGLALLLPKQPELFSFPEKERLLRVPEEYRGEAVRRMQDTLDIVGAATMVVFLVVQVMLWRTAHGHRVANLLPGLIVATIAFLPLTLWLTSRVNDAAIAAEQRWLAATGGKDSRTSDRR